MNIDYIRNAFHGHQCEPIREFPIVRASVLLPLVETDGEPSILFEERNANIPQGGEVCFPGGRDYPFAVGQEIVYFYLT